MLCHGPHSGKQPTFVRFDEWVPASRTLDRDDALRTIAERYFASHGPATLRDFTGWTGLTVADAKTALHLALPSLERLLAGDDDLWMSANRPTANATRQRAHLLPGFDEFMLGYKDRSAALAPRHASRIVPGGNGMFMPTLVLDGKVCGTWRRAMVARSMSIQASPFIRLTAADRKAFLHASDQYAHFLGVPLAISWSR
jgi:hypothetical protein